MNIIQDDLTGPQVRALLKLHFAGMRENSPEGSCHFLDFEGLRKPDVTFWSIWDGDALAGCGALKELDATHGEIKSMRTHQAFLRRGVAARMLDHIMVQAKQRGYGRLSLETGSGAAFEPALGLYERHGFERCAPFADYVLDPFSIFMTRTL